MLEWKLFYNPHKENGEEKLVKMQHKFKLFYKALLLKERRDK